MKEEYVWISKLEISNKLKFMLIKKFNGVENLYNSSLDDLIDLNLKDNLIFKILNKKTKLEAKRDLEYMQKNNIDIIWYENKLYPKKLKNILDPPVCFYIKGNKEILNKDSVGIVGSRTAFKSSLEFSREISKRFSENGINVVSGLARGVDKFAHLGSLNSNSKGKTIAILGNGIESENIYPLENKKIYEKILELNGTIISEYPLKTKPLPYNFPYRNRIISGLSDKIIVVQASLKSGSLITVDYALEQGKDVYVLNDKNINSFAFEGNKLLIEQGAKKIDFF